MAETLTFDCYGTLLNTDPIYEYIETLAHSHGLGGRKCRALYESYEDRLMYGEEFRPYQELLKEILSYLDQETGTDLFSTHYSELLDVHARLEPWPDVIPALRKLKEQGYRIALLSNTSHPLMTCHLRQLEFLPDEVLLADDLKCYKPDLRFFRQAAALWNLPEPHFHIAHGYWWDIVPAARLGWKPVWIRRGSRMNPRTKEEPCLVLEDLSTLPEMLARQTDYN